MSTPTRLSDAIREGSKLRQQGFGTYFPWDERTGELCSCALGAASEALITSRGNKPTYDLPSAIDAGLWEAFEEVLIVDMSCPVQTCQAFQTNDYNTYTVHDIIEHLNNGHKWTREAVAAWVQEIEQRMEA